MLVCIGSKALEYRNLNWRPSQDLDLVGSYDEVYDYCRQRNLLSFFPIEHGKKIVAEVGVNLVEAEITWKNSSAANLIEVVDQDPETIERDGFLIPSLDFLYLLKMSHRYLRNSPHFLKTMDDIKVMRDQGAKINSEHLNFYKARQTATYNYSHPNLKTSKTNFFNGDGVNYVYDHDSIHEAVKNLDAPAYTYFKDPNSEVFCDKRLFFQAPKSTRLYAVLEEAYVLALERSQIPYRGQVDSLWSFDTALMKVCTSITSGWFREFAWEHYYQVKSLRDEDYVAKFFERADKGLVKLYETK